MYIISSFPFDLSARARARAYLPRLISALSSSYIHTFVFIFVTFPPCVLMIILSPPLFLSFCSRARRAKILGTDLFCRPAPRYPAILICRVNSILAKPPSLKLARLADANERYNCVVYCVQVLLLSFFHSFPPPLLSFLSQLFRRNGEECLTFF